MKPEIDVVKAIIKKWAGPCPLKIKAPYPALNYPP